MLPVPPLPVQPVADPRSGGAKRSRRNALPQAFFMLTIDGSERYILGAMELVEVQRFAHDDEVSPQFYQLVQQRRSLNEHDYCVWTVGRVAMLCGAPMRVAPHHLTYQSFVFDGLTMEGLDLLSMREAIVGNESVPMAQFFLQQRPRLFLFLLPIATQVLHKVVSRIVTPIVFARQAGLDSILVASPPPLSRTPALPAPPSPVRIPEPIVIIEDDADETKPESYDPDVMFAAMRFSTMLKNQSFLRQAVRLSAGLLAATDPAAAGDLIEGIDSGRLRIPGKSAVAAGWNRLDCLSVLWERELQDMYSFKRYLMADASPKLWNYFSVRETRLRIPKDVALDSGLLDPRRLADLWETHSWQVTVLGHGASHVGYKYRNLVHNMVLLSGGCEEKLLAYRLSVIGWTSDQGTERKLADAAYVGEVTLARLQEVCRSMQCENLPMAGDDVVKSYLFPNALYVPGHQHLLYNALEQTVTSSRLWSSDFSNGLRSMLSVLSNRSLRDRLIRTCLFDAPTPDALAFRHFARRHLDWRWESLGEALTAISGLVPILMAHWSLERMEKGDGDLGEIDMSDLKKMDSLLRARWVRPCIELLRILSMTVNEWGSWMEGCPCHEHVWRAGGTHEQRQQRLQQLCGLRACPWKGCRGPELATVALDSWLDRLRSCGSVELNMMLQSLPAPERGHLVAELQHMKEGLIEIYESKFGMWRRLPYSLIGLCHSDLAAAKKCAKAALLEWAAAPHPELVHRVALKFFQDRTVYEQLQSFAAEDNGDPLASFPRLHSLATQYGLVSLVERAVEGEHAKIENASTNGSVTPATICCRIRAPYLLGLLDDRKFAAWCRGSWRIKVFRDLLSAIYHSSTMNGWTRRTQLERVYLFGLECQFEDTGRLHDALKAWESSKQRPLRALTAPKHGTHLLCLAWLKGQFQVGRWLSLPDTLVDAAISVSGIPVAAERPLSIRDLYDGIQEVADMGVFEAQSDLIVFRVVHATPNSRVSQHAWHLGAKGSFVRVAMYGRGKRADEGWEFYPRAQVVYMDLDFLAAQPFGEVLRSLGVFKRLEFGTELVLKPYCASLVAALSSVPAIAASEVETDIVPHDMSSQALESSSAAEFMRDLARQGAWAENGTFVSAMELSVFNGCCLDSLVAHGIAQQKYDEFGNSQLALSMQNWFWMPTLYCVGFQLLASLPAMGDLKDMNKLDMVLALTRQGFKPARENMEMAWFPDGADEFSERMLMKGTKLYFLALLRRHEILERGAQYIMHDGSVAYFRALLTLKDLTGVQVLRDEGQPSSAFEALLDGSEVGLSIGDARDGDLNSDDDDSMPTMGVDNPVDLTVFAVNPELEPFELPPFEGSAVAAPIVRFDNCSHSSGIMRAYSRCAWQHPRCFKYIQLNVAGSRQRAIAHCAAWNDSGRGLAREEHVGLAPDPDEVDSWEAMLFP